MRTTTVYDVTSNTTTIVDDAELLNYINNRPVAILNPYPLVIAINVNEYTNIEDIASKSSLRIKQRDKLIKHFKVCQYCNGVSKNTKLELEHIIPKSLNGSDTYNNLTIACHQCNKEKSNYLLHEWLKKLRLEVTPLNLNRVKILTEILSGTRIITLKSSS